MSVKFTFNGRVVDLIIREETNRLVVHHSASHYGDAREFDLWHRARDFKMVGYHYIILNGYRNQHDTYNMKLDGVLETGRPIDVIGAHAKGANPDSIGICLVGKGPYFSVPQISTLVTLCADLSRVYGLSSDNIKGHRNVGVTGTACPGFDTEYLRAIVRRMT